MARRANAAALRCCALSVNVFMGGGMPCTPAKGLQRARQETAGHMSARTATALDTLVLP